MKKASLFGAPFTPSLGLEHRRIPLRGLGQAQSTSGFTAPPPEGCPTGQFWDGVQCSTRPPAVETPSGRTPSACRRPDGRWDLYDGDSRDTKVLVTTVDNVVVQGQDMPAAPATIAAPGFCEPSTAAAPTAAPPPAPVQPTKLPDPWSGGPNVTVLPKGADLTAPSACDPSSWMRSYPARMGEVRLRRRPF